MPLPNRQTVLVTGMNGFVGSHVAKTFLDHGWAVIGTVRSAQKGENLIRQPAFTRAVEENSIRYIVVEDLTSFDFRQVMEGVDALAHIASPCHYRGERLSDYAIPAILGTSNILNCAKESPRIKAVVVTSSFGSIINLEPAENQSDKTYTEEDWFEGDYEDAEAQDDVTVWYCTSKKLAEKKAWEIKDSGATWSLTTVCPPSIFGPVIHTRDLNNLNETSGRLYKLLSGQNQGKVETRVPAFADVRDLGQIHFQAILQGYTGRFLVCSGDYDNQRVVDFIRQRFPHASSRTPLGIPGNYYDPDEIYKLDSSKVISTLGLRLKSFDQTFGDTIEQYLELEEALSQS